MFKPSLAALSSITCALSLLSAPSFALDEAGQRYLKMFANGGPSSIRSAAESIFNTGNRDKEVLDAAAETLAQNYQKNANSETYVDAYAWLCKALGNSGDGRYKALVTEVADQGNKKLRKHCTAAAKNLPKDATPYVVGSVNLAKYKENAAPAAQTAAAKPAAAKPAASGAKDFSVVREGMSKEEVESLIGVPTAMSSHITGKQFRPFNFRGKDTHRIVALYKGIGRIVYSNSSQYSSTYTVLEIVADPNESGYP